MPKIDGRHLPPHMRTVITTDTRKSTPHSCFYCSRALGEDHEPNCVMIGFLAYEAAEFGVPYLIEDYPEGHHALFWFPHGERGVGGFETATAYRDDDGVIRSGWTHGGPNSGGDFDFCEPPTLWYRLPNPPHGQLD